MRDMFSRISKYLSFKVSGLDYGKVEDMFFHSRSQFLLGAAVSSISIAEVFSHKAERVAAEIRGVKTVITAFKNEVADDLTLVRVEMEAQTNKVLEGIQKILEEKNPEKAATVSEDNDDNRSNPT